MFGTASPLRQSGGSFTTSRVYVDRHTAVEFRAQLGHLTCHRFAAVR